MRNSKKVWCARSAAQKFLGQLPALKEAETNREHTKKNSYCAHLAVKTQTSWKKTRKIFQECVSANKREASRRARVEK